MKVTYVGPARAVDVAIPGGSIRAVHGEATEVPDDLARRLLEQDTFEAAKATVKENK